MRVGETNRELQRKGIYKNTRPEQHPCFMALCPVIVEELETGGIVQFPEGNVWKTRSGPLRSSVIARGELGRRTALIRYWAG